MALCSVVDELCSGVNTSVTGVDGSLYWRMWFCVVVWVGSV
jgi:hypothetical protein